MNDLKKVLLLTICLLVGIVIVIVGLEAPSLPSMKIFIVFFGFMMIDWVAVSLIRMFHKYFYYSPKRKKNENSCR